MVASVGAIARSWRLWSCCPLQGVSWHCNEAAESLQCHCSQTRSREVSTSSEVVNSLFFLSGRRTGLHPSLLLIQLVWLFSSWTPPISAGTAGRSHGSLPLCFSSPLFSLGRAKKQDDLIYGNFYDTSMLLWFYCNKPRSHRDENTFRKLTAAR